MPDDRNETAPLTPPPGGPVAPPPGTPPGGSHVPPDGSPPRGAGVPPDPGGPSPYGAADWSPAPAIAGQPRPQETPPGGDWSAPEPRDRSRPIGLALVLIGVGVLWLLALAGVSLPWELVVPAALVVTGALVLLSPLWGGGSGLVGFGIALAIFALVVAVPSPAAISAGDRTIAITDVADLEDRYGLGAGTMTLDLRGLQLPPGTTEVVAGVNLGELVVVVPPDVTVTGEGRVFLGEVEHFDRTSSGVAPRASFSEAGDDADRVLELRLRVGLGQIEVRR
jgi:hypothetical protein